MHETSLLKNIFDYLQQEEQQSCRKIKKIYLSLSEFGGLSQEHLKEHYRNVARGTRWETLDIEINKVPYGPELQITKLEFA